MESTTKQLLEKLRELQNTRNQNALLRRSLKTSLRYLISGRPQLAAEMLQRTITKITEETEDFELKEPNPF